MAHCFDCCAIDYSDGTIFFTYGVAKMRLSHEVAAPAGLIGASNFFELAVAVAIALLGLLHR